MKRAEVNEIIKQELAYIPKGSKGSIQNRLRFCYSASRRKGIANGKSRQQCLDETVNLLKVDYPKFEPEFDKNFFGLGTTNTQPNTQQSSVIAYLKKIFKIGN